MNTVDAKAVPVIAGYEAHYRLVHKAGWRRLTQRGGSPMIFPTAADAEVAAWRKLRSHLISEILGTSAGLKASASAEIGRIFPGKGRRPVTVERR